MPRMRMRRASEERVNERRHGRALGEYDEGAKDGQHQENGEKPVFLTNPHEAPQFPDEVDHEFLRTAAASCRARGPADGARSSTSPRCGQSEAGARPVRANAARGRWESRW